MGFTDAADLKTEIYTNGKLYTARYKKTWPNGAGTAGRFYELFTSTGMPGTGTFAGSAGIGTVPTSATTGALDIGPNVSTDTKHILSANMRVPAATMVPGCMILVDIVIYYPACTINGSPATPTTLDNTATISRYTDGLDLKCFVAIQATATGTASIVLTGKDAANNTITHTTAVTNAATGVSLLCSDVGSGSLPFVAFTSGTSGPVKITSYTSTGATGGTVAIVICKPILVLPVPDSTFWVERDYLTMYSKLPQIKDNACLAWLAFPGGALANNTIFSGEIQMGWG